MNKAVDFARDAIEKTAPDASASTPSAVPRPSSEYAAAAPVERARNWEMSSQAELVEHIVSHHHEGLRRELPALVDAARQLERAEAEHPAVPRGLADTLAELAAELEAHMLSEEDSLFPLLRADTRRGPIAMQIRMMERDHDGHAASLRHVREQTANLTAPDSASAEWTDLYARLATLEAELREHIHLEDAILFARASGGTDG